MFCANCGAKLEDGELFCSQCGTRAEEIQGASDLAEEHSSAVSADKIEQTAQGAAPAAVAPAPEQIVAPAETVAPAPEQIVAPDEPVYAPAQEAAPTAPVQTAPADYPAEAVSIKPAVKKKRMGTGGAVALCILFGIFIFAFVTAASALFSARTILTQERISAEVSQTNPASVVIGDILLEENVFSSLKETGIDVAKIDEDTTVGDLVALMFPDENLHSDDIEELLDETAIMSELGSITAAYERYILTGEDSEPLSAKKLLALINKYKDKVYQFTGLNLGDYSQDIETSINDEKSTIKKLNPDYLLNGAGRYTSMALSLPAVITVGAAALLLAVLLGVITKRFCAPTLTLGICCTLCGVSMVVGNFISSAQLRSVIPYGKGVVKVITDFTRSVCAPVTLVGAIAACVGVVLIVTAAIVLAISRKKQAKS